MNKNLMHGTMALLFVLVVCISSAAAVDDTVTRDLPASASAGATITVDLTVDVETGATYYYVDEAVPSGWTVTGATGAGDYTSDPGHVKWLVFGTDPVTDTVYSYTVDVPAGASGAYTFGGTYMFEGMADEVTILGDTTVIVGDVDTVTRDLPASASAGATITVDLTVDVETGATYYYVDEAVPSGWTVTGATGAGDYTSDPGHVKWLVFGTDPVTDTVYSYTVDVPAGASGAYTFGGTYMFEGMADEVTILGDTTVTVTEEPLGLTTITVSPATANLTVGDTEQFTATAYDQYDAPMAGIVLTWTTQPSGIGTVDPTSATTGADGTATTNFTAVAEGTTTVAAYNGTVHGTAAVTVEYDSADTDHDCVVDMVELMVQIGKWRADEVEPQELMDSISRWRFGSGGYC